ncbi:MAG TPA: transglutaminase family protein [Burkholderiales bacterium]|nr:transglutaminase family protein [Burkholderiales bacterium]
MTIKVALTHETRYRFDRPVGVSPHEIRLRPAPHCRTPVSAYSLKISPAKHFLNWQQDPYGNWIARAVFPEKTTELKVTVDLVADLTVINPFDFFVESYAENYPFSYPDQLRHQLMPYLTVEPPGPLRAAWLARFRKETLAEGMPIANLLVAVNASLQRDVGYIVRMEPGVQTPEQTLQLAIGSCRDSGWLLVQLLRDLGIAARFVSGYLMQIASDQKPLDGPAGPEKDFADLHAWAEAFVPGAGWVGLDPTSGLLAGEGHIPLACTESPGSAAPITGSTEICQVDFGFDMQLKRIYEDPRVTKPFTPEQWQAVDALGEQVDVQLKAWDVRLTMGGEPTFVSIDDMDGVEWNLEALGEDKRRLAGNLLLRLNERFAHAGVLHFGQGKWFPGEPLPRWALGCFWRADGKPLWKDARWLAEDGIDLGHGPGDAERFARGLTERLALDGGNVMPAYEDIWRAVNAEQNLPADVDPLESDLASSQDRLRLARMLNAGLDRVAAYVLPLKAAKRPRADEEAQWLSSRWPLKREHLYLIPGDSPAGYRLPLDSLPKPDPDEEPEFDRDPFEERDALHEPNDAAKAQKKRRAAANAIVRSALCVQVRGGSVHVFLPPLRAVEDWIDLVAAVEATAGGLGMPVVLEGYQPPVDPRICRLFVTPDPGVIEVNIHPSASWRELTHNTAALYEEARNTRLGTEKFMLDGRHTGTGGGNHVTIGGNTAAESPLLRRPDLVRSLVTYWQNHPALSYLFSGLFIGPTSQAPRVDEARDDNLYELEIAFQEMDRLAASGSESPQPWLVDRLLRNFLVDLTGNTHRAEFSIDKLYSPHGPTGRLGLLEFRAFEMPPHWQMSALQMLLLRALIARLWKTPYRARLIPWGTSLHDSFMLPHFVAEDFRTVIAELNEAGYAFRFEWFAPFFEFRFPFYGMVNYEGVELELRQALEPWHVLGEEAASGGATRYVDASVERLQVNVRNPSNGRYVVACNGRPVPLTATGRHGEFVAGVRFKAWQPPSALHPTIRVHAPLVFDIVDTYSGRSIGGCTYHVAHPGGRNYETLPVNAFEAEARRVARFMHHGHTPGPMKVLAEQPSPQFPHTLDLRRQADHGVAFAPALAQQAAQQQQ